MPGKDTTQDVTVLIPNSRTERAIARLTTSRVSLRTYEVAEAPRKRGDCCKRPARSQKAPREKVNRAELVRLDQYIKYAVGRTESTASRCSCGDEWEGRKSHDTDCQEQLERMAAQLEELKARLAHNQATTTAEPDEFEPPSLNVAQAPPPTVPPSSQSHAAQGPPPAAKPAKRPESAS